MSYVLELFFMIQILLEKSIVFFFYIKQILNFKLSFIFGICDAYTWTTCLSDGVHMTSNSFQSLSINVFDEQALFLIYMPFVRLVSYELNLMFVVLGQC